MDTPPGPGNLTHNERVKLTATWMNSIASGTVLVGIVAPAAAMLYGTATPKGGILAVLGGVLFLFSGIGLHFQARRQMKELRE
jgi:uncharacterized protein involved in exopolysaccharide biosynthesis